MDKDDAIVGEIQQREPIVKKYVENCKKYQIAIDPSVVISLLSGWKKLQPTVRFGEGEMVGSIAQRLIDSFVHTTS
jgi:hypothetical protein